VVYRSDESGRNQIYVQPFPPTGAKYQITTTGAFSPLWSPDGKQIFYGEQNGEGTQLVSVDVRTQPGFGFANATKLPIDKIYTRVGIRGYDITPDGKQFLIVRSSPEGGDKPAQLQMRITLNWFEELKQRAH
jgi:eukaryotic-like serine/threonine-protein kinase